MLNLMKSEVLRFRNLALAIAALHIALLWSLQITGDLVNSDSPIRDVGALAYAVLGATFGVLQTGPYRKLSQWTFLIHRPMSPTRIWLALNLAAVLLLAATVMLPMLIVLAGVDAGAAYYIDLRFYLLAPYIFGLALAGYLAANFILLTASRVSVFVLALPVLFMTDGPGLSIFIPQVLVVALLAYLGWRAFRADLHAKPERVRDLVPAAFAVQWGLYFAMFGALSVGYQVSQMIANAHPLYNPAPDTFHHARAMEDAELVNYGLGPARDEADEMLRQEVAIADIHHLYTSWDRFPLRHQLYFADKNAVLQDRERGIRWPFSHDQMLFKGLNARTSGDAGWMGLSGRIYASLEAVPEEERLEYAPQVMPQEDDTGLVILPRRLYKIDFDQQQMRLRYALPEGEWYQSAIQLEGNVAAVVTNRNVHLFAPRDVLEKDGLLQAEGIVPLPDDNANLMWIDVTELVDGHLLTFFYGNRLMDGWGEAAIHTVYQPFGGEHRVLNVRELQSDFPDMFHYRRYIVSPLFAYAATAVWSAIQPHDVESVSLRKLLSRPLPANIIAIMLLVSLFSGGMSFLLAVRAGMPATRCIAWGVSNALTGLPGLVCFLFLTDWRIERSSAGVGEAVPS